MIDTALPPSQPPEDNAPDSACAPRQDLFRFGVVGPDFDPECETRAAWAARVLSTKPATITTRESLALSRLEFCQLRHGRIIRVDSQDDANPDPVVNYSSGNYDVRSSELVGQFFIPGTFTLYPNPELRITYLPALSSPPNPPPRRAVPKATSTIAAWSGIPAFDRPLTAEDFSKLCAMGTSLADRDDAARGVLVVHHGWSVSAAIACTNPQGVVDTHAGTTPTERMAGDIDFKARWPVENDTKAAWDASARAAILAELDRLRKCQDLLRIAAGLDPYYSGPLAVFQIRWSLAEARAAVKQPTRWPSGEAIELHANLQAARAHVIEVARETHSRIETGAGKLSLAVLRLNTAEAAIRDTNRKQA